jgi:hypothetical protein
MILASVFVIADLMIAFAAVAIQGTGSFLQHASNLLILEFGIMLVAGGCLMSRQPLEDKKRYDSSGKPTTSWEIALLGREILVSSMFVLIFSILLALAAVSGLL